MCLLFLGMLLSEAVAQIGPPPVIVLHPLDQTLLRGGTASFTVVAASGTTLSYQWYAATLSVPAMPLEGEISSTLTLTNVSSADDGQYHVEVKNAGGKVASGKATLVVSNAPPVANNDDYTTSEEVPLTISAAGVLGNDTDVDGDALRALLESNVTNGSLSLNSDGSFTYIANSNYFGSDSFTYRVSDGLNRAVAILQQNVSGGNKIEIRNSDPGAQSFRHGSAGDRDYSVSKVTFRLSRNSAPPNRNLSFSIGTGINSGAIAGSSFAITMASITNTSGGSSFQDYAIVYAAPIGPFAAGTTYYLNFNNSPNGKEIFVETSGNNAYANGTYYAGGDNTGEDMRFKIYGITNSDIATVNLTVTPVNDPPMATSDTARVGEDRVVSIPVLANDVDPEGTPLTLTDTSTTNGIAVISGANVLFTPSTNFHGTVVFGYTISDGTNSATANVTVTVTSVNDDPVANNDTYTTLEDVPLTVPPPAGILTNDADVEGDVLTAVLVNDPANGSVSLNSDGSFTYTPNTDFFGSDSFTYRARDGQVSGNVATVTIILTPVDDPLNFSSQRMTANGFELQVSGPDSSTYIISASTNLIDWTAIFTNYTDTGSMTFTDTGATNDPVRFYRVEAR